VVGQIVNAIPELKDALTWAVQNQASQDALNAKIAQTPWYQQHSDPLRNLLLQAASDPATYAAEPQQRRGPGQPDRREDGPSRSTCGRWPTAVPGQRLDQRHLEVPHRPGRRDRQRDSGYAGDVAKYETQLNQVANDYGVPFTQGFIDDYVNKIQTGQGHGRTGSPASWSPARRRRTRSSPSSSTRADPAPDRGPLHGADVQDPGDPADVGGDHDPAIQKALSTVDPKTGSQTAMPLWQFTRQLKDDPRYDQTDGARKDAYTALGKIGAAFGFYTGSSV
jgi:hypothetical protein